MLVHMLTGLYVVLQDREQDKGRDARGKTSIIKHQAAVQRGSARAQSRAKETGRDSGHHPETPYQRAETRREGDAVDVSLRGDRPFHASAYQDIEKLREFVQQRITHEDRPHISGVLTHGGKCERSENDTEGRTGEARARCEVNGKGKVEKEKRAVKPDIYQAERHAVFTREVTLVAGVGEQKRKTLEAPSVEKVARDKAAQEKQDKEHITEASVRAVKAVIDLIRVRRHIRSPHTQSAVEEIVQQES